MNDGGQSIVEFLLLLPILFGFVTLMVRVNTAIQMSIVNQKYARSQALWLSFNSPQYPEKRFHEPQFIRLNQSRMIIGVSDNQALPSYAPYPPVFRITRNPALTIGSDDGSTEPTTAQGRGRVRVRTTVSMCSPDFLSELAIANVQSNVTAYPLPYCVAREALNE